MDRSPRASSWFLAALVWVSSPACGPAPSEIPFDAALTDATTHDAAECSSATECADGNACTVDACPNGACTHSALAIDDADACTVDSCNPITGVSHVAVSTDDADACTTDACNSTSGVSHVAVPLDDADACTNDACDSVTGPSHAPLSVDDGDGCTTDACDAITGVSHAPCGAGLVCAGGTCRPCVADGECGATRACYAGACVAIAQSCLAIKTLAPTSSDGLFTIDLDLAGAASPFLVYCDMTSDGGGWTLAARMTNGCSTYDRTAVGSLVSPSQASCAKLSDADINTLASAGNGVFWAWQDSSLYPMPASGRYLRIISGTFDAYDTQPSLTQQCSCAPGGPWSATYGSVSNMAGVYTHSSPGGYECVTVGSAGCTATSVYPNALFLYQHVLRQPGTFPSDSHGITGGSNGWLFVR